MPKLVVAVLVHAADARACVAAGVGSGFEVRHHATVQALLTTLDEGHLALVVIDAVDPAGRSMASAVMSIRYGFPTVPILAYCSLSPSASATVLDVARAGVTGLVFRGVDDVGCAMRAAIRSAVQGLGRDAQSTLRWSAIYRSPPSRCCAMPSAAPRIVRRSMTPRLASGSGSEDALQLAPPLRRHRSA